MAKIEEKKPVVQEISEKIEGAASVVLVDHRGLTVAQDTELRKQLREAGVQYKVYKNTMMRFAFKGTDFEQLDQYLDGPSAAAICKDDATAPARILYQFAAKADKLEIKGGVVEGKVYDKDALEEISFKRRAPFQVPWKHSVSSHQLRSRYQSDRRAEGRRRRGSSTCSRGSSRSRSSSRSIIVSFVRKRAAA